MEIIFFGIVLVLGIIMITLLHKEYLNLISGMCKNCGKFISKNSGFFTIFFLILFFIEQLILIIGVYLFDVPLKLQTWIGIFALIVVTTATLQKFIWEYKFNNAKKSIMVFTSELKNFGQKNRIFLSKLRKDKDEYENKLQMDKDEYEKLQRKYQNLSNGLKKHK